MRVSGVFRLWVGVFGKAPAYKKSPMPWGFHSTRLLWFAMLFWASEKAAVTLNQIVIFGINEGGNIQHLTPPTLVEPENDKIFERLHTARTAIPNHLPAITLPTNPAQTRIHPGPPHSSAGSPRAILFSLFFSFVYAGSRGFRAPGRGICQGARVQKKPYAVGVPQHKA